MNVFCQCGSFAMSIPGIVVFTFFILLREQTFLYGTDTINSSAVHSNFTLNSMFSFKSAYDLIKHQRTEQ